VEYAGSVAVPIDGQATNLALDPADGSGVQLNQGTATTKKSGLEVSNPLSEHWPSRQLKSSTEGRQVPDKLNGVQPSQHDAATHSIQLPISDANSALQQNPARKPICRPESAGLLRLNQGRLSASTPNPPAQEQRPKEEFPAYIDMGTH